MKRFKHIITRAFSPDVLAWLFPFLLIVPNVVLDFTEQTSGITKIANVFLPLGIYLCIVGLSRKIGRTVVLCLPFIFFAAFQVVLLYLYGESIIAVDMYLNVVTTSVSEATELLGNLGLAIATVVVVYLLPLIWAVIMWCRKDLYSVATMKRIRKTGLTVIAIGMISFAVCVFAVPRFNFLRDIFPANVVNNMVIAIERTDATTHYFETSSGFNYAATSTRPIDKKEIYVLVVGETSRADNWQLLGYDRPTNPLLSERDSLVVFSKAISESNTTHKSVPLALSCVSADNFGDSIYYAKSIVSAFNQAGYRTAWLSNQARNHSFIDFYAREAQLTEYLGDDGQRHYDLELLAQLQKFLDTSPCCKNFVVLHTYGSHFNYCERYPATACKFTPDSHSQANRENRRQLLNAYDNTIAYTDGLLDSLICMIGNYNCMSAIVYFSDHGEDIFDDRRERFLHASPVPTYHQLHVPVALWLSPTLCNECPHLYHYACSHRDMNVSSSRSVFDTVLELAGISTPYSDSSKSLTSTSFVEAPRKYLNDYNEGVALNEAGIRDLDRAEFDKTNISYL